MGPAFAIRGMKKGPTLRVRLFLQIHYREARAGDQTIYASL